MKYLYRVIPLILIAAAPAIAFGQANAEQMVLLTGEEGPLGSVTSAEGLPAFLNNLYTLIIGAAVILAVLQIIRGGIMWMLTDSFVEKGQARHLVTIAVMGLILVLSPVIVFNIINPCILSLSLRGSTECEGSLGELTLPGTPDTDEDSQLGLSDGQLVKWGRFKTEDEAEDFQCNCEGGGNYTCESGRSDNCNRWIAVCSPYQDLPVAEVNRQSANDQIYLYGSGSTFENKCEADGGTPRRSAAASETTMDCPSDLAIELGPTDSVRCYTVSFYCYFNGWGNNTNTCLFNWN